MGLLSGPSRDPDVCLQLGLDSTHVTLVDGSNVIFGPAEPLAIFLLEASLMLYIWLR